MIVGRFVFLAIYALVLFVCVLADPLPWAYDDSHELTLDRLTVCSKQRLCIDTQDPNQLFRDMRIMCLLPHVRMLIIAAVSLDLLVMTILLVMFLKRKQVIDGVFNGGLLAGNVLIAGALGLWFSSGCGSALDSTGSAVFVVIACLVIRSVALVIAAKHIWTRKISASSSVIQPTVPLLGLGVELSSSSSQHL